MSVWLVGGVGLQGEEICVGFGDSVLEGGFCLPAEGFQRADIEEFSRDAIGAGGIEGKGVLKTYNVHYRFGQFPDGDISTGANVIQAICYR